MPRETRGTHSITRTGLRVASEESLKFWHKRLGQGEIIERDGRQVLDLEDPEGQRLTLVADPSAGPGHPWNKSPVPPEHQIRGLGPITISVPNLKSTALMLTHVMNMRQVREYRNPNPVHVFEMGEGGAGAELHVAVEPGQPFARQGAGGVHHVAFRVPDEEQYHAWAQRLNDLGIRNSGEVDRFYFRSLYFREPNGILFELATDGPGFASDEPLETMGQKLALPPFLEHQRNDIEAGLKPLT